jgi:hypothetical protein
MSVNRLYFFVNCFFTKWIAYFYWLLRKALKLGDLQLYKYASEIIEVCPCEVVGFSPPVSLEGQINKATASQFGYLPHVIHEATRTNSLEAPTNVYRIQDVIYNKGFLYKGFIAERVSSHQPPSLKGLRSVDQLYLCSTPRGSRYFGDWLIDNNALELLANELGGEVLKVRPHTSYPHLPELNKLLELRETYNDDPLFIKNLYLIEDSGYTLDKRKRLQELRSRIRKKIKPSHEKFIYLCRGASYKSNRGLVNEEDVITLLTSLGFLVIDPTQTSATELLTRMMDCSIVVSIEGSQEAYSFLALKEGGVMMTLEPPYRFEAFFRPRAESVGVRWGFIVGDEVAGGFTINIDDLARVVNKMVAPEN